MAAIEPHKRRPVFARVLALYLPVHLCQRCGFVVVLDTPHGNIGIVEVEQRFQAVPYQKVTVHEQGIAPKVAERRHKEPAKTKLRG
jgi:hypothetical protein